ncbi:conserved hypothetical protein [Beggiatoa sp. PS]|nr:conserved hypothetical protein [Beggiatoa sp. PS]
MDQKIIFLHIPKTAGTSLRQLIQNVYPGKQCLPLYYPWPYQPAVIEEIKGQLPDTQILYGHTLFGIHELLNIQAQYVTFLRNPIDRVISFYNHNACHSNAEYYATIQRGVSLLKLLKGENAPQTNNLMTRMIAPYKPNDLLDDDRILEQAIDNIEKQFCFVGLVEKMAESVELLSKKLGWPSSYEIPYLNAVPSKQIDKVDAQTKAALEKYNRLDILLYQHIQQQL